MSRILIADCTQAARQVAFEALGARTNPALFEAALRCHEADVTCAAINLADNETLPAGTAIGDFDGVIFTGSPLHVGDATPEVLHQIDFARAVFADGVPVWGSCWGLQLATVALGGAVRRSPAGREIGVARAIAVNEAGRAHPLLAGRAAMFDALCSHLDEVTTLPPGGMVLAGNRVSAVQAMAVPTPAGGGFYGTQYHPELDLPAIAALCTLRADALAAEGFGRGTTDLLSYAEDCRALDADHTRADLTWRYGIGPDILDPVRRTQEIGNWLRAVVQPGRGNFSR